MGKKKRKNFVPPIAEKLPELIVDNHTHIAEQQIPVAGKQQAVDEAGELLPPIYLDTLLAGMEAAGVAGAITSGCDIPSLAYTRALAEKYPNIGAALAIHPNEAALHAGVEEASPDGLQPEQEDYHREYSLAAAIEVVAEAAQAPEVVAVGESGLDYFRTGPSGKAAQKEAFRAHIALAKELGKPLQIHDREAHADVVDILRRDGAPEHTVFHCFSGDRELAEICARSGWYASFSGNVTYPANADLRAAFLYLPTELILVETDAPYLTPLPYRGHPNVVWGVAYTARYLAECRGIELAEWCKILRANTRRVYDFL